MKSTAFVPLAFVAILAVLLFSCTKKESAEGEAQKPAASPSDSISLDTGTQERLGIELQVPDFAEIRPRLAVTGRVIDVTGLAAEAADLVSAQAAADASQAERSRLKTLVAQNNASERALQAAEAAATRDQAQADAARIKLAASWGQAICGLKDLGSWLDSLASGQRALVRIDLPAGERPHTETPKVKLHTLSGTDVQAEYLDAAPTTDPQTQGRSWYYLVQPNTAKLLAGMAVEGYLEETGSQLRGLRVPRAAVIRYKGEGWVYQEFNGTNFVRTRIPLELPVEQGWFVADGTLGTNRLVVTGAQSVLSRELNATGFQSGDRD